MSEDHEKLYLAGVGGRIRTARDAAELKLEELARLSGLSVSALSLIETGKRDLRVTTLRRIAEALRAAPGALLEPRRDAGPAKRPPADDEGYDLGDYN